MVTFFLLFQALGPFPGATMSCLITTVTRTSELCQEGGASYLTSRTALAVRARAAWRLPDWGDPDHLLVALLAPHHDHAVDGGADRDLISLAPAEAVSTVVVVYDR